MCVFSHLVAFISVDVLPVSRHIVGVRAPSAEPQTTSQLMATLRFNRGLNGLWFHEKVFVFGAMLGATDTRPRDSPSRFSEFHDFST